MLYIPCNIKFSTEESILKLMQNITTTKEKLEKDLIKKQARQHWSIKCYSVSPKVKPKALVHICHVLHVA